MSNRTAKLGPAQIASLDAVITAAQQKGRGFDDRLVKHEEQGEQMAEVHMAMWEARHGGLEMSDHDRIVLSKVKDLMSTLEMEPTLGQLLTMRGQAVHELGG